MGGAQARCPLRTAQDPGMSNPFKVKHWRWSERPPEDGLSSAWGGGVGTAPSLVSRSVGHLAPSLLLVRLQARPGSSSPSLKAVCTTPIGLPWPSAPKCLTGEGNMAQGRSRNHEGGGNSKERFSDLQARGDHLETKPFILTFSSKDEERGHCLPLKDAENSSKKKKKKTLPS